MPAALEIVRDPERAGAMLQPVRAAILERLAEPGSATSLARKMEMPRQVVNYHLRELERRGLVEFVEERRRGNCVERVVRATAAAYVISPEALGPLAPDPEARRDRSSAAYLVAVAARAIRDLAVLGLRAARARKRLATLTLETGVRFRSAADRTAFAEELANSLARLAARYHDEAAGGGRWFRFFVGGYPAITREENDGGEPGRLKEE